MSAYHTTEALDGEEDFAGDHATDFTEAARLTRHADARTEHERQQDDRHQLQSERVGWLSSGVKIALEALESGDTERAVNTLRRTLAGQADAGRSI